MAAATPLDPSLDPWTAQQDRVKQMLAQAEALRQATNQPTGQMVSGHYIAPSIFQQLIPVMNQIQSGMLRKQAMDQNAQIQKSMQEDASKWMSAMPQATSKEYPGPTQDGSPLMVNTKPTQADILGWANRGMQNPLTKALAAAQLQDTLIQGPIRQEKALEARQVLREKAQDRLSELQMRLQDRALDRQSREAMQQEALALRQQLAADSNALRRDLAAQSDATRRELAGNSDRLMKTLFGSKDVQKLDDANSQEIMLGNATQAIKNMPNSLAVGWGAGVAQNMLPGGGSLLAKVRPPEVNNAIQQLTYMTDEIRHGRFGSALTATEKASASQYLPSEYDDKATLLRKAEGLQALIQKNNASLRARAAQAGFPGATLPGTPPQNSGESVVQPQVPAQTVRKFNPATGRLE